MTLVVYCMFLETKQAIGLSNQLSATVGHFYVTVTVTVTLQTCIISVVVHLDIHCVTTNAAQQVSTSYQCFEDVSLVFMYPVFIACQFELS